MKIVNQNQLLRELVRLWKLGTRPAFLETETKEKLLKGSPFGDEIRKLTFAGVMLGADYEKAMIKATGNADFQASSLPWGKWITFQGKRSPIISHKGKAYLRASFLNSHSPVKTAYIGQDGKMIDKAQVAPWRKERKGEVVTVRNYTLANVKRCNVNGERFVIV